ncbi:hypothetical protein SAMN05444162_2408 [Paenibacillaceae bacterium GAS479]|nr:hypothetical protein SAMN05444162_2408 [Paenibacillaceae bacterium GAS479]
MSDRLNPNKHPKGFGTDPYRLFLRNYERLVQLRMGLFYFLQTS